MPGQGIRALPSEVMSSKFSSIALWYRCLWAASMSPHSSLEKYTATSWKVSGSAFCNDRWPHHWADVLRSARAPAALFAMGTAEPLSLGEGVSAIPEPFLWVLGLPPGDLLPARGSPLQRRQGREKGELTWGDGSRSAAAILGKLDLRPGPPLSHPQGKGTPTQNHSVSLSHSINSHGPRVWRVAR